MKRTGRLALLAALAWAAFGSVAHAVYQRGPVLLDPAPSGLPAPLMWTGRKALVRETLPPPLVRKAEEILGTGKGVLLVGHTDAVGPKLLNRSLGLQQAMDVAYRLARELNAPAWKFHYATLGESGQREEPGVELFAWALTPETLPEKPTGVSILSPPPEGDVGIRFRPMWDTAAGQVVWATEGADGINSWRVDARAPSSALYYPARLPRTALGGQFNGDSEQSGVSWKPAREDARLALTVEAQEPGWSRLSGKVPEEITEAVIWAGDIPYPVTPENGKIEANVARFPSEIQAYAQGADARGRTVVGPRLTLPGSPEMKSQLLAVLVWEGSRADLDLHLWSGGRHTHPLDPDPALSPTAVPGTRILFDGDGFRRASALVAESLERLELEVTCFSDFGGGADAYLYLVEHPGDPISRTGRILGPRHLSNHPTQVRWPAHAWRGSSQ